MFIAAVVLYATTTLANVPPVTGGVGAGSLNHGNADARNYLTQRREDTKLTTLKNTNREIRETREKGFAGFTYDPAGNLLSATNQDAVLGFSYDSMNRIVAVTFFVSSVLPTELMP